MSNPKPQRSKKTKKRRRFRPNNDERYPTNWIIQREVDMPSVGAFDNKIYNVVDGYWLGNAITSNTTIAQGTALSFALNSCADYASLTAVFDQYRIMAAEVTLMPSATNQANNGTAGHVWTVLDYDDSTALSSIDAALDYPNVVVMNGLDSQVRSFVPHVAVGVYGGSTFTSYGNRAQQWLDAASPGVPHFGYKIVTAATSVAQVYDASVKLHIQFRNPR
jgi:hypothetical protein